MPLTFFEDNDGEGTLPFLNQYKQLDVSIDKPFQVLSVKKVNSGKGYIASTSAFSVFLWAKKSITTMVLEALDSYTTTGIGYALYIVPTDLDGSYEIAADFEVPTTWRLDKKGKYSIAIKGIPTSVEQSKNPFLPVALTPSTTSRKKQPTPGDV